MAPSPTKTPEVIISVTELSENTQSMLSITGWRVFLSLPVLQKALQESRGALTSPPGDVPPPAPCVGGEYESQRRPLNMPMANSLAISG